MPFLKQNFHSMCMYSLCVRAWLRASAAKSHARMSGSKIVVSLLMLMFSGVVGTSKEKKIHILRFCSSKIKQI